MASVRRAAVLSSHVASSKSWVQADVSAVMMFVNDESWKGKPFWMLNVLKLKDELAYAQYGEAMERETLPKCGARMVSTV